MTEDMSSGAATDSICPHDRIMAECPSCDTEAFHQAAVGLKAGPSIAEPECHHHRITKECYECKNEASRRTADSLKIDRGIADVIAEAARQHAKDQEPATPNIDLELPAPYAIDVADTYGDCFSHGAAIFHLLSARTLYSTRKAHLELAKEYIQHEIEKCT